MIKKEVDLVSNKVVLKITNGSNVLTFDLKYYGLRTFNDPSVDQYHYLNKYLDYKGVDFKNTVFKYLEEAMNALNEIWVRDSLDVVLKKISTNLINMFDSDDMYTWISKYSGITIPSVFTSTYNDNITINRLGTRAQTYISEDYQKLIGIAIIMRMMTPIWSEYISRHEKELGTLFKEFYAFMLISDSNIISSEPYKKLYNYIGCIVDKNIQEKNNINKVLLGIASEDLVDWTTAITLVRRLSIADFDNASDSTNLVTNVFGFTSSKMKGTISIDKALKDKKVIDGRGDDNDKTSSLENYKIVSEIPPGTIEELDFSVSNYDTIFDTLAPTMTAKLKNDCFRSKKILLNNPILPPQLTLLKWVMHPIINSRGIIYLSKDRVTDLMCITQAVLWHMGHKYLSLLATSVCLDSDDMMISDTSGRSKINKQDLKNELDKHFPYKNIKRSYNGNETYVSSIITTIGLLDDEITKHIWTFTMNSTYIKEVFGESNIRPPIPYDIRILLANLCIDISNRGE